MDMDGIATREWGGTILVVSSGLPIQHQVSWSAKKTLRCQLGLVPISHIRIILIIIITIISNMNLVLSLLEGLHLKESL